jgi:Tfp pilus assembly protein PilN
MIRINLLGVPKKTTRGGRRASTAMATGGGGEGSSTLILGLIFAGALAVLIGLAHVWVQREHDVLEKNLQKAVLENQRLADVKAKYEASKKKADMYERRVRVIDELKSAQSGPVDLLNLVADTINSTDAVWLETMTNDGKTLNFTGMALSPNSVADLMANLRKTGAFKTVEIKETAQDNAVKEVQAFKFELICEMNAGFKANKTQRAS